MRQRGRKSVESQAVLSLVDLSQYRPDPPDHLTEEQQDLWSEISSAMKPGSFPPPVWPLLCAYCIHVSRSRSIAAELRKVDIKKDMPRYKTLASMLRNESAIMCQLASQGRIGS
jgi:hypothetical protein